MIGDRLGNWVIYKELGRGGMGRVYLAQEELGGRRAAIKVLASGLAQEIGFLQRFQQEIDALRKLDHPNVVRFYESGCENDLYYCAMEYVEGETLEKILENSGRMHWNEALEFARQICPALKHAHDHGIIHRDLKPANLMRTTTGLVKLMDFGIAKIFAGKHLTATGGVVGTAEFISPEQAAGKPATKRSDLYSLGVVLYVMVTGRPPFQGRVPLDLIHKHRYARFDPPSKIVPDLPHEIDEIICRLLEKDPDQRPPDALVLGRQLEKIQSKLERKSYVTEPLLHGAATMAPHGHHSRGGEEGAATLMSRLVRDELERQKHGSGLQRFLNHPIVLVTGLLLCIGIMVWTFWPLSREQLYERGAALMESDYFSDWQKARREYLEPLNERFPNNPYKEEVDRWLKMISERREERNNIPMSEAERFFAKAERHWREGNFTEAKRIFSNLVDVFATVESEAEWVNRAKKSLILMEKRVSDEERWQSVEAALKKAAALYSEGKREEAARIWSGLEELYHNDPTAAAILEKVRAARKKE